MTWDVKPEHWGEYKDIHLNAGRDWPELLKMFSDNGVHNFQCFAFNFLSENASCISSLLKPDPK